MFHRPKSEDTTPAGQAAGASSPSAATPEKTENAAQQAGFGQQGSFISPAASQSSPSVASVAPSSSASTPNQQARSSAQPVKTDSSTEKEMKSMNTPVDKNESPASEGYSRPLDIPGTAAFQRPGVAAPQAARPPGAYTPGSYGTASPYGSSSSSITPDQARNSSRRLVVGEGITMSGEIESCDTLIVEGTVEAALKGASILDIAESGMFYGTVEIDECTIAGRFEGDITVHGRLTVKASGSITGSISYKELAVEAGATVDGKMSPLNAQGKKAEKKDMKAGKKPGPQGGELPFAAGHASAAE